MKIIFSRKGFDSGTGGCPSPIIDGVPLSLPIPTRMPTVTCFRDLTGPYGELVSDLTNGRLAPDHRCHLDPDIDPACLQRGRGWRGSLGQEGAAQSHLANQGVAPGDVFIFWGLFREVIRDGRWRFVGPKQHRIFGWMQIGEVINLGPDGSHAVQSRPWLRDHPHARPGWGRRNALYVASEKLELGPEALPIAGSGILRNGYRLTADGALTSTWNVPDWLNPARGGCGMTYNPPARWSANGTVRTAARGQEFVAVPDLGSGAIAWIADVLQEKL